MNNLYELERLADALPIPVWMARPDGEVFYLNQALLDFTGHQGERHDSNALFATIHPEDREPTRQQWQAALAAGHSFSCRFRLAARNGDYRWTCSRVEPIRDPHGAVVRWYGSTLDIHEQKLREESAAEQARRLVSSLDSIIDGFVVLDRSGGIRYLNATAADLLQHPLSDCAGRTLVELLPESAARKVVATVRAALDGARTRPALLYLKGRGLWCEMRCSPHEDGLAVSLRDVTEERRTFQFYALQARVLSMIHGNASLTDVLDALVLGFDKLLPEAVTSVWLLDDDGVHVRLGSAPSLPAHYHRAVEGMTIGPHAGSCGAAMYRRRRVIVENIATSSLWREYGELALGCGLRACWSTPMFDGGGQVLGCFAVYYRVPKRPSESELALGDQVGHLGSLAIQVHRQETALRESEERFRQMDEAMDDVFWMKDLASDRLIYLSPTVEKLSGDTPAGYDEATAHWASTLVHPDDRPWVQEKITGPHRDWQLRPEGLRYRIVRGDGEIRWVSDRAFLIRDAEGNPWRLSGVIRDITDQLALERRLRESQRMEALGQLTGGIAHDFNNLLTVILGNAELLQQELERESSLLELAEMIEIAALRGSELTQRLLAFARRQPLEPRVVAVDALVDDMLPLLRRSLGHQLDIRIQHRRPQALALVDPAQLESALLNLCLNARDALHSGGILTIETAQVTCGPELYRDLQAGEYLQLSVTDDGVGIAAEHLERVFEPFFTTKEKTKGTGLGLAMVYGFAKQSRGLVTVSSEPGQGSTFALYLPVAQALQATAAPVSREVEAERACNEWVLLVEDDPLVRTCAHEQLVELGYRVRTAGDGHQALNILRSDAPVDLLFTDVVMPGGLSGPELAREARRIRSGLRVLYTSGYPEDALENLDPLDAEVLLLRKPYKRTELASKLRLALTA